MNKFTAHSEYGKLKTLLLKCSNEAFRSQQLIQKEWKALNYLSPPDFERANTDYERFLECFENMETERLFLPPSDAVTLDSIYCRDASIATNFGMIICRMGKGARRNEPGEERKFYEATGIRVLGEIQAPGTLEGGDVAWLDENTLAVGHTYRSNYEGIAQLKAMLEPKGIQVIVVELPHFRGPEDVFHLMSILSPVDRDKAVVYSPLMPINFRESLIHRGFTLIEVPEEEYDSMGCNVFAVAPADCIMLSGNPITRQRLEAAGCTVTEYDGKEISHKGCGGPTCLTRPIWRYQNDC